MEMGLSEIRLKISQVVQDAAIAPLVEDVRVEAAKDEDDDDFLRVYIRLKPTDRDIDTELVAFIEHIEDAVAEIDERYPSVRFLDAA
jgi:hypothetical protein